MEGMLCCMGWVEVFAVHGCWQCSEMIGCWSVACEPHYCTEKETGGYRKMILLVCCLWTSLLHREGDWGLQENDTFASSSTPQINFTSPPIATVQLSFIYDQIFSIVLTSGLEFRTFYGQSPVSQLALSLHGMWSGFPYYFPWNTAFWRGTWLSLFLFVTSVCSGGQLVVKWNQQYIGDSDPKCCALVNISCALVCMW